MALYTQRRFVRAFRISKDGKPVDVLAFVQQNVQTQGWEIDYCNKVTKDTMQVDLPAITSAERQSVLTVLDKVVADHGY
jgi:hypothetical protein